MLPARDQNLGYGQVLGRIADSGDALVVDGYLGAQELAHILEHTDASRFLIGDRLPSVVSIGSTPAAGLRLICWW